MTNSNLGKGFEDALKGLGLTGYDQREGIEALVCDYAEKLNVEAKVVSLRYGKLTLAAPAIGAQVLRFEKDNILAVLEKAFPGEIQSLIIRLAK